MENKGMPYQVMLDRYQQTIRELHIEKLKDRNLFDLSGGQKQTIAFASVYALNPDIFVLGRAFLKPGPRGHSRTTTAAFAD